MEKKLKRQQRTVGAIVKIPLENGYHSYARILEDELAFYNIYTQQDESEEYILSQSILFVAAVFDDIITKGYWEKIGKSIPLETNLLSENLPPKFKQDIFTKKCQLVYPDRFEPATEEQCKGLERWSVWTAEGIANRLLAHYTKKTQAEIPSLEKDLQLV